MENEKSVGLMFKSPLVLSILNGVKTQTRREVKLPRKRDSFVVLDFGDKAWPYQSDDGESELCNDSMEYPYANPFGDLIYIRETFAVSADGKYIQFKADGKAFALDLDGNITNQEVKAFDVKSWSPAIHMKRKHARIWCKVESVFVEKLIDISDEDAIAEGVTLKPGQKPSDAFIDLWKTISDKPDYELKNTWVWVCKFKRI